MYLTVTLLNKWNVNTLELKKKRKRFFLVKIFKFFICIAVSNIANQLTVYFR